MSLSPLVHRWLGSLRDVVGQFAYRTAYHAMRKFKKYLGERFFSGSVVAVLCRGRVLLVQSSYRTALCLPGGRTRPGETPEQMAFREIREEVGILLKPNDLVPVGNKGCIWLFEMHFDEEPSIRINNREIIDAAFYPLSELPALPIDRMVREYLSMRCARKTV